MTKTPERVEHERLRGSLLISLIGCVHFIIAAFILLAVTANQKSVGAEQAPPLILKQWIQVASRVSYVLIAQASPITTSLAIATLATALVIACSFGRKPDTQMLSTEIIRLRFLETITGASCAIGGSLLITLSAVLVFAGWDALASSAAALACGLLTLSLGAMVPVSSSYWETHTERERTLLDRLERSHGVSSQPCVNRKNWIHVLSLDAAIRTVWILGTIVTLGIALRPSLNWGIVFFVLPLTLIVGLAWDVSVSWSGLELMIGWVTNRWISFPLAAISTCAVVAILLAVVQISLETHWLVGVFLAGCITPPLITAVTPGLNHSWKRLRTARLQRAIQNVKNNIARYEILGDFTRTESVDRSARREQTLVLTPDSYLAQLSPYAYREPSYQAFCPNCFCKVMTKGR